MSEMADRFTVDDPVCGFVNSHRFRDQALRAARDHEARGCKDVTVYDRLARIDNPQLYTPEGKVISRKVRA